MGSKNKMAKNVTLYIDDETEKLLKASGDVNYSKLFQKSLKNYLLRAKSLNKEAGKLPCSDEIEEQFKFLPSIEEIEMLNEELGKLPSPDDFEDCFKSLPSVAEIEELNNKLNETIEKLERIKELKGDK